MVPNASDSSSSESPLGDPPSGPDSRADELTRLIRAADGGDVQAEESLWQRVYDELRELAQVRLRKGPALVGLQPTMLVGEAWLRLGGGRQLEFSDRAAFFRAAASAMRNALVDEARREASLKRGGDRARVTLADVSASGNETDVVLLSEALERLEELDARAAKVVELRYFAGLKMEEVAEALDVGLATAERDWRFGRTWLRRELGE